jgi:hypothetical protein
MCLVKTVAALLQSEPKFAPFWYYGGHDIEFAQGFMAG